MTTTLIYFHNFYRITSFSLSVETGEPGVRQMLAVGLEDARVEVKLLVSIYFLNVDDKIIFPF